MHWYSGLEAICRPDVPLAELTWYRLGGPARWLVTPRDEGELADVLRRCRDAGIAWRVLGRGANVLVRDAGFDGAIITLTGPYWETITVRQDGRVEAFAGADFPRLIRTTLSAGLVGLEALAGIPGTIGGAVHMNAGGRYGTLSDFVQQVRLIMPSGEVRERDEVDMGFGYRTARLDGGIVTRLILQLEPGDERAALERFRAIWQEKYANQPAVSARSAGCIFKNPLKESAGRLLDHCGLKGQRIGNAEISTRHANFIIAHPGATAGDVVNLIAHAKERVRRQTGFELELEVEIW